MRAASVGLRSFHWKLLRPPDSNTHLRPLPKIVYTILGPGGLRLRKLPVENCCASSQFSPFSLLGSPLRPFGASLRPEYLSREPSFVSAQASLLSPSPTKLWRPTPPAQKRNGFPYILTACCQASKTSSW